MANKRGRQTPTQAVVLPYEQTKGKEAIDLYNSTERTAQEWQELLAYDMMAVNEDGLWVHQKFGYSVPRRNGKSEDALIRCLWGLKNGEHILWTAHRATTSHSMWERLERLVAASGMEITSSLKAFGKERIEVYGTNCIEFRTRTSSGGLGEGYDLVIIDEAQEYTDDQETSLKYVVSDSANPQTILLGTPPTAISSGTVFLKYRRDVLSGNSVDSAWEEWSVEHETDPNDIKAWYETNPSMGTILNERKVKAEIGANRTDFNIQRLGLWIRYNQASAITETEWKDLKAKKLPAFTSGLYVGIKFGIDGANVAVSIALKTKSKKIFVEAIDCRPVRDGVDWILQFLKSVRVAGVVIDGKNGQGILAQAMKDERLKKPVLPTVSEIIMANAEFEPAISAKEILHMDQPSLTQAVSNCEKRSIGSGGGFGYKSTKEGIEIALMDSVILARWLCTQDKERRKQRVSC